MQKIFFSFLFSTLLFACAQSPQSSDATLPVTPILIKTESPISITEPDELTVIGRLKYISTPPHCGYFHIGAVAEYTDLKILDGTYLNDTIYVVHGCPELARKDYAKDSGGLKSFHVGDYHTLRLTTQNVYNIGLIDSEDMQLPMDINHSDACTGGCDAETFVQLQEGMMFFCSQVDLHSK